MRKWVIGLAVALAPATAVTEAGAPTVVTGGSVEVPSLPPLQEASATMEATGRRRRIEERMRRIG